MVIECIPIQVGYVELILEVGFGLKNVMISSNYAALSKLSFRKTLHVKGWLSVGVLRPGNG